LAFDVEKISHEALKRRADELERESDEDETDEVRRARRRAFLEKRNAHYKMEKPIKTKSSLPKHPS
jgi:hypothetical protein